MRPRAFTEAELELVRACARGDILLSAAAEEIGCAVHTVRMKIAKLGLQFNYARGAKQKHETREMPTMLARDTPPIAGEGPFKDKLDACDLKWRTALAGARYT